MDAGFGGLNRATLAFDQVEIVPGAGENRTPFTLISARSRHGLRVARVGQ